MSVSLTVGAVEALCKGETVINPVLQLLVIRTVGSGSGPRRFRLMMSDGLHSSSHFLLVSQFNHLVEDDVLKPNCVCLLKRSNINTMPDGRRLVVVLDMDVLKSAEEVGRKIGNPILYHLRGGMSSSPQEVSPTSPDLRSSPEAEPGPSRQNSSTLSSPRGRGKASMGAASPSPTKSSPMKASPALSSPRGRAKALVGEASPSPTKSSPVKASPGPSPSSAKVVPIAFLNPYQSKWTVRGRVANKSDIRTWSNSRGDGTLFSFELADESGEIRITAFKSEVDKFFSLVEQGKVYYISKGMLKIANKQYTSVKNDYEITLHSQSTIVPCDDGEDIPAVHCDFVPIAELENRDNNSIIDVIGVCKSAEDVSLITTRSSREVSKRAIQLMDASGKMVSVTLWGEKAETFNGSGQPVVAVKAARLSDFGGRSLSVSFSSTVMVNPDIPQAFELRAWFDQEGHLASSQSLTEAPSAGSGFRTNWKTLSDIKTSELGHGDQADYFSCVATVVFVRKENCLYRACPSADCNKKVTDLNNGLYRCGKCNREFPNFKHRLLLSVNLADFGDNQWVTCFQDTAEVLLGQSADALGRIRDTDEDAFDEVFQKVHFSTHIFRNRVKMETYNDESRLKVTVVDVQPVDHRDYSRRLLRDIQSLATA